MRSLQFSLGVTPKEVFFLTPFRELCDRFQHSTMARAADLRRSRFRASSKRNLGDSPCNLARVS